MFPFGPVDTEFTTSDYILPATEIDIVYNGSNVTAYFQSYSMSAGRESSMQGNLVLKDRDGYIAELVSQFNPDNANVRAHNMTDTRTLTITMAQGTASVTYPTLIPGDPSWDNDGTVSWTFTDKTPIIDLDNQTIGDYLFTEGDTDTSHTVIDDIEVAVGETITPDFTAYNIGTFRANETNIVSAIDALGAPRQAYRKWIADVLHMETLTTSSSVMSIIDRLHIPEGGLTMSYDTSSLRTYFKFFRDKPMASYLGEAQCTGLLGTESQCVGRVVEITFSRPTLHAIITHTETNGSIEDGVFYNATNDPITQPGGWFNFYGVAGNEAVKWLGTYVPDFTLGTDMYIPSWRVRATGGSLVAEETGDFEVEKIITAAEALYGRRPEYKNLETELLRDPADATAMLNAIALEVLWSIKRLNLNTPFLIPGREGDFIALTHYKLGLSAEPCLIHSWSHSYSPEGGWDNSYELRAETT